jgi:hypothetical protein
MNKNSWHYVIKSFLQRCGGYYYPSDWFCDSIEKKGKKGKKRSERKKNVVCDFF